MIQNLTIDGVGHYLKVREYNYDWMSGNTPVLQNLTKGKNLVYISTFRSETFLFGMLLMRTS